MRTEEGRVEKRREPSRVGQGDEGEHRRIKKKYVCKKHNEIYYYVQKNKSEGKEPNAREVALLWEVIQ